MLTVVFYLASTHLFRSIIIKRGWLKLYIGKLIPKVLVTIAIMGFFGMVFEALANYLLKVIAYNNLVTVGTLLAIYITNVLIYFFWALFYFIYHYVKKYNESLKIEAAVNEIRLNNLKSQLNPHFMFNALNSIRALVDEDPFKAKNAITQLSNILRNSLQADQQRLTRFRSEIQMVEDYLELETIRFEERLKKRIRLHPDSDQFEVPPLMIQTLVENGIKHGISTLKEGGLIEISTDIDEHHLIVKIRNSGQYMNGRSHNRPGGYGLANTRQRLKLIYGDQASFNIKNENKEFVLTELKIPQSV